MSTISIIIIDKDESYLSQEWINKASNPLEHSLILSPKDSHQPLFQTCQKIVVAKSVWLGLKLIILSWKQLRLWGQCWWLQR